MIIFYSFADVSKGAQIFGHTAPVLSLLVLRDGRLVSGHADSTIAVWDSMGNYITLSGHTGDVFSLAEGIDGQILSAFEFFFHSKTKQNFSLFWSRGYTIEL